jgi:hypothetical protein
MDRHKVVLIIIIIISRRNETQGTGHIETPGIMETDVVYLGPVTSQICKFK